MSEIHVAVKASLTAGQGLFTSRDTNPGELLFSAPRPFLAVLDTPRLSDTCSHCFKWIAKDEPDALSDVGGSPLKACGGCRAVRFCNKVRSANATLPKPGYHFFLQTLANACRRRRVNPGLGKATTSTNARSWPPSLRMDRPYRASCAR